MFINGDDTLHTCDENVANDNRTKNKLDKQNIRPISVSLSIDRMRR